PMPEGFPDPTPFFFGITGIAFVWTIYNSGMLEAVEFAHDAIVQNLSNGIVVLDLDDRILDINPAALAILEDQSREPIGLPFFDLVKEDHRFCQSLKHGLGHIKKNGDAHYSIQISEHPLSHEIVFSPVKD
ncbi:PAS domain-containing protein, partial [candidate division KSB1 bacterium]|nr:PAS domain-containing protein [candidate division KSB1 bacterium]